MFDCCREKERLKRGSAGHRLRFGTLNFSQAFLALGCVLWEDADWGHMGSVEVTMSLEQHYLVQPISMYIITHLYQQSFCLFIRQHILATAHCTFTHWLPLFVLGFLSGFILVVRSGNSPRLQLHSGALPLVDAIWHKMLVC